MTETVFESRVLLFSQQRDTHSRTTEKWCGLGRSRILDFLETASLAKWEETKKEMRKYAYPKCDSSCFDNEVVERDNDSLVSQLGLNS